MARAFSAEEDVLVMTSVWSADGEADGVADGLGGELSGSESSSGDWRWALPGADAGSCEASSGDWRWALPVADAGSCVARGSSWQPPGLVRPEEHRDIFSALRGLQTAAAMLAESGLLEARQSSPRSPLQLPSSPSSPSPPSSPSCAREPDPPEENQDEWWALTAAAGVHAARIELLESELAAKSSEAAQSQQLNARLRQRLFEVEVRRNALVEQVEQHAHRAARFERGLADSERERESLRARTAELSQELDSEQRRNEAYRGEGLGALGSAELQRLIESQGELVARAKALLVDAMAREVEQMKRQHEKAMECVICFDAKKSVLLAPCNHLCVCEDCAPRVDACPLCRQRIGSKTAVHLW